MKSSQGNGGQKKVETWDEKNNRSKRMLERNIFPWLGSKPITEILPKDILTCLRRVEDRGTFETAHRTLQICGQVFRYAVATGRVDRDVTPDLRGALPPAKSEHFAAITEPKQVAELLRAIDSYQGSFTALCALNSRRWCLSVLANYAPPSGSTSTLKQKNGGTLFLKLPCSTSYPYRPKP